MWEHNEHQENNHRCSQRRKSKTLEQSLKIRRAIVTDWSEEQPFRSIRKEEQPRNSGYACECCWWWIRRKSNLHF